MLSGDTETFPQLCAFEAYNALSWIFNGEKGWTMMNIEQRKRAKSKAIHVLHVKLNELQILRMKKKRIIADNEIYSQFVSIEIWFSLKLEANLAVKRGARLMSIRGIWFFADVERFLSWISFESKTWTIIITSGEPFTVKTNMEIMGGLQSGQINWAKSLFCQYSWYPRAARLHKMYLLH